MENTLETMEQPTAMVPAAGNNLDTRVAVPLHTSSPTNSPLNLIEIPFVHWKLIAGTILSALLLSWLLLLVWPRTYESESRLMIRVGRESVALDPTATVGSGGRTLLIQKTRMEEMVSALSVLDSRKVREAVVEELGAESILSGYLAEQEDEQRGTIQKAMDYVSESVRGGIGSVLAATGLQDPTSEEEQAVLRLKKSVIFHSPRESSVVAVHAKAKTPEMAQAIATSVTKAFIRSHMDVSRTPGATNFFERQVDDAETKLNKLVGARTKFMQDKDLMSVGTKQTILQTELISISTDLVAAKGQLEQAEAELAKTNASRERLPETIVASSTERKNETYSGMRQKLFDLETKQQRLEVSLTDSHPLRAVIAEQISELRDIVDSEEPTSVDESTTPNPELQRLDSVVQDLYTKIAGLKSLIEKKELQHEQKAQEVENLLSQEKQLVSMERDIKVLTSSLDSLKVKLEESRVIDEMGRDEISNVSVFQPASLIEKPLTPQKQLVSGLALGLGSILGLAWAFMREAGSEVVRSRDHLRTIAHATPVYSIEKLRTINLRQSHRNLRREAPKPLKHLCKHILADFLLSEDWGEQRRLGVLSYERGNGASTLARELALACSNDCGIATTLIDTDLEGQSVAKSFGVKSKVSLGDFAAGRASLKECSFDQGERLQVVPFTAKAGETQLNGSLDGLVHRLKHLHDPDNDAQQSRVAIVDLSPVRDFPEAAALARTLDSIVVVVESEKTTASEVYKMLRYLEGGDARILCFVLNKTRQHIPRWLEKALGRAS